MKIIEGFDDQLIKRLHELIILDTAYRVRIHTIKLIIPYIHNQKIEEMLIPMVLKEYTNCSYLVRLTVLFFIRETYRLIQHPAILAGYNNIIGKLAQDKI